MKIDATKVDAKLADAARIAADGGNPDDGWWKHCKRVLRVSTFFTAETTRWRLGIVLLTTSRIDKVQTALFGKAKQKCTLSDMVDPRASCVAKAQSSMYQLLAEWSDQRSAWTILNWLAAPGWTTDQSVMIAARKNVIALGCGLFRRPEVRLVQFPYKLQHIISPNVNDVQRLQVAQEFVDA